MEKVIIKYIIMKHIYVYNNVLILHISLFKALLFLGRNFTPLTIATGMLMAMLYQNAKDKAREKEMEELNERLRQIEV